MTIVTTQFPAGCSPSICVLCRTLVNLERFTGPNICSTNACSSTWQVSLHHESWMIYGWYMSHIFVYFMYSHRYVQLMLDRYVTLISVHLLDSYMQLISSHVEYVRYVQLVRWCRNDPSLCWSLAIIWLFHRLAADAVRKPQVFQWENDWLVVGPPLWKILVNWDD